MQHPQFNLNSYISLKNQLTPTMAYYIKFFLA